MVKLRLIAALSMVAVMALSACDSGRGTPQPGDVELQEPANKDMLAGLSGQIIADGSSTVFPITSAASEEFNQYARRVRIPVGVSGTGGGFKKFCNDETDIQNASRSITPAEMANCTSKGIEFVELPIAYDGIAVVVNPQNTWADQLTVEELKKIWEPDAQGKITNWNQIRSSFPDKPLKLYGPGTDSGTFEYFTEAAVGKAKSSRGDYQASEDDNVLVTGVAGDEGALGYFGLAYFEENADKLKLVPIVNKEGKAVIPSIETVKSGDYQPLSRPLFLYVKKSSLSRTEAKEFLNFYLDKTFTPMIQARDVGYITLSDELYAALRKRANEGITGTLFPNGAEVGATLDRYLK